ncbi:MAG: hypothetical protein ACI87E_002881 [Mariniblastus sp.]|jgi:hypothetical protein
MTFELHFATIVRRSLTNDRAMNGLRLLWQ